MKALCFYCSGDTDRKGFYVQLGSNICNTCFLCADDKKEPGAARRSRYYMKYGNPNYGGMKGILSNSW